MKKPSCLSAAAWFALLMTGLLVLLSPMEAAAQRAVLSKMSPLVREAWLHARQERPHFRKGLPARPAVLTAFVKTADAGSQVLETAGCRVLARYGTLAIAEIPLNRLDTLARNGHVLRIEAGRRATALMDTTALIVQAPAVYEGLNLPQGYTGRGVLVGVQDIGFDLTHPNFYSSDFSTYRVRALWDQLSTDTLGSALPVGRDYVGRAELLSLGHPRDGLIQTHGTHTAGIAAGSGAEGPGVNSPYRGIAYESDLCLVSNAVSEDASLIDPADYYKYTFALDALGFKYIFDQADRMGKPCVINFSEGSQQDFHGYDRLYYEMLDSLCGPGRIIVSSAGNAGQGINYVEKPAGTASAGVFCTSGQARVYATAKADGDYTLRLSFYRDSLPALVRDYKLSAVLARPDSMLRDTLRLDTARYVVAAVAYPSAYDASETVCDWAISTSGQPFRNGAPASLQLVGREARVELFPVTGSFYHSAIDPTLCSGDNTHSVYSPASAPRVICVGATAYRTQFVNYLGNLMVYDNGTDGRRTPYSAVGPTWDGRLKPDVMAPGQNVVSSYSSFYLEHNPTARDLTSDVRHFTYGGRTYAWNSNGGTSMASPVVAGVIALWLQADPKLTPEDCLEVMASTCRHPDPTLHYPNQLYGHGEIDAYAGLQAVLVRQAAGVAVVSPRPSASAIYRLDGRYAGTDVSRLQRGIYVRAGQKIVVRH